MDMQRVERLADSVIEYDETGPLLSRMNGMPSNDQAIARNVFDRCQEVNPDSLFMNLARMVRDCHQDTRIRMFATKLLKQRLVQLQHTGIPVDGRLWDRITSENRNSIKSILLSVIKQETTERRLMLELCATISSLALRVIPDWLQMRSFIILGLDSASPSEAALLIFAESPEYVLRRLGEGGLTSIKDDFSQILANDSLTTNLKIAALRAVIKLISCLSSPEDTSKFQKLVTPIMRMTMAVMREDETNGREVLGLLNGMDPSYLMKKHGQSSVVLGSVLHIAEDGILEKGTRQLAIHLMTKLVESAPDKISNVTKFIKRFLSLVLNMMSDIEDEPGWDTSSSPDEYNNYSVGKQCFTRFATAVDAFCVFPIAFILIKDYLNATGWKSKHAALIVLAQVSVGCSEAEDRQQVQTTLASLMEDQRFPRIQERAADIHREFDGGLLVAIMDRGTPIHYGTVRMILLSMSFNSPLSQVNAQSVVNRFIEEDPDRLFMKLSRAVEDCDQDTGIRTLAAHLLEEHLVQLQNITPENQNSIKSILLSVIQQQTIERPLMLKLCATISSLASNIPNWPEMYTFIRRGLSSASPSEAALLILAESPEFVLRSLGEGGLTSIKVYFSRILANDSLTTDLKIAALRAAIKLISCLSSPEDTSIFQYLVTPIMRMTMAVMGEDETNGHEVLGLLNGMDPNFLMKEQELSWVVLGSALDIAENDILEEETRHSAVHLMTDLAESAPAKISIMAPFTKRFLSLMLKMMTDIEDEEPGLDTSSSPDESSNYFVGKQCFTRLVTARVAYSVIPIAFILIKDYLNAPGWESKHAALIALAQVSDGCSEVMTDNIKLVVFMAIKAVQNDHLCVRRAAGNAICHLAKYCFSFQAKDRQQVQTALASLMEDQCFSRIQEWAADIHHRFGQNLTAEM